MRRTGKGIAGGLLIILFLLALLPIATATAQDETDPQATAQAAERQASEQQWRADQAANAAQSARATAQAAWGQATAQAAQATAAAVATRQAFELQTTATAVQVTAESRATAQALQVEATRQVLHAQATATAQAFQTEATRAAVVAEQDRLQAERERLAMERSRRLQPLLTWGPWAGFVTSAALFGWLMRKLFTGCGSEPDPEPDPGLNVDDSETIEGEFYERSPGTVRETRCMLRPRKGKRKDGHKRPQWRWCSRPGTLLRLLARRTRRQRP